MYVIGISAYYHDSSVCLFKNNELVFAIEEEKFSGIKHDKSFPELSLKYLMKKFKLNKSNIEAVCYYENPQLKLKRIKDNIKTKLFTDPIYCLKSYLKITNNIKELKEKLSSISDNIFYSTHHESHLYYSYYTSPFDNALIVSIDGVGESDTISMGVIDNDDIRYTSIATYPHSIGLFYSAMTSFLGFKPNEGEYKVMGLAPYGNYEKYVEKVRDLISIKWSNLKCNMDLFTWDKSDKLMFNEKLPMFLGIEPRLPEETITQDYKDLAAATQKVYEEVVFQLLKDISIGYETDNLCLGGGCAYNGSANGKIPYNTFFKNLWIPPSPSDAGSAIGACVNYLVKNKKLKNKISKNPFTGPHYYDDDIFNTIKNRVNNKYHKFFSQQKLKQLIAKELNNGKVVGWYQGHCEFGSRALGNRSILANPTLDGMKDKINKVIKKREGFRPFAPMVIKEKQHEYFEMIDDIPYMNQVVKVKPDYVNILKAVTHVDGTARVQTVHKHTLIHDLLLEFEKVSGYPILLNTSFNVKDKTMVLTPKDAMDTFFDTEMDILVMGNYVIYKK